MKKSNQGKRCSLECIDTEGRPRHLSPDAKNPVCEVCRANLSYWKRQPPARRILRTARVALYARRMEQVS